MLVGTVQPYALQGPDNPDGVPREAMQAVIDATLADRPAYYASLVEGFVEPGMSDAAKAHLLDLSLRAPLSSVITCAELGMHRDSDFRRDLATITKPVLFVHGDRDAFFPYDASALPAAESIDDAALTIYKGGGHGLIFSMKERLCAEIATFARCDWTKQLKASIGLALER